VKPLVRQIARCLLAFLFSALIIVPSGIVAQVKQEVEKPKKEKQNKENRKKQKAKAGWPSPRKATFWGFLPGAGQIYNKKYWKLPIVYAGFGVMGYFAFSNRTEYLKYKDAFICSSKGDNDPDFTCDNPLAEKYSTNDLETITDYYRRNMELSFIIMGAWYILQILDATVDANLYYWNVDDNLTLKVEPVIQPFNIPNELPAHNGIRITLKF